MFLDKKPNFDLGDNDEANLNILKENLLIGKNELPFTIDNILNLNDNSSFSLSFQLIDGVPKIHIKEITESKTPIKILLPISNQGEYSLFISRRLEYLCKDVKYFNCYVSIQKYEHIEKRYILTIHIYLKTDKINEIYDGITSGNVLFLNVKDILIFLLTTNYTGNINHQIQIKNIKNVISEQHVLTKEYKVKPFNYQLENIKWCKNVEQSINSNESIKILNGYDDKLKLDSYYLLNDNILYLSGKNIIKPEPLKSIKYFFHTQGGLLCDNTGLGKTLTLSVHITDDNTKIADLITNRVNMIEQYKNELDNSQLEDIVINKTNLLTVLYKELHMLKDEEYKLKTNCNLLIVPVRLLQQWESEIKKYLPSTCVYLINTIRDFNKLKLEDIDKYTIIIISITFLQNPKRSAHPLGFDITNILWKRVIVDEVHELFNQDANSRRNFIIVNNIKCMFKWGISATPNLQLNCDSTLLFLTNGNYWVNEDMKRYYRISTDVREYLNFLNTYFRYNEIKKVNTEIHIPPFEEKVIELEMSNIEKLMYNNATGDVKRMIALCTNYKISNNDSSFSGFATVSELKNKMLEQHSSKKNEHIAKIDKQNTLINHIKEIIEWFYTERNTVPEHIKINYCIITGNYYADNLYSKDENLISDEIERVSRKLDSAEKQIESMNKELKLIEVKEKMIDKFDTMIESNLAEPCMICFGSLDTVMITTCNHMYCGICVNELFKNTPNIKCPMCRTPLTRNEVNSIVDKNLNLISADDMKKKIESKEEENINIHGGGTKMNAMVKYIKDTTDKIIIFALEKQTLDLINDILIENKIKYVNLKGNAYVLSKQLKKFKTGEEQVMLLSADRSNSGTNLIEANHIILLDTHLIENLKTKQDIEKQAIGRAVRLGQKKNVQVVRFIMKNTIEQVYLHKK
jgi:SNF2 family DNA or RNA helicase